MNNPASPFAPGLSLEEARKAYEDIQRQFAKVIEESKKVENTLGHRRTFPGYTGR
jgi:hypothetical protein